MLIFVDFFVVAEALTAAECEVEENNYSETDAGDGEEMDVIALFIEAYAENRNHHDEINQQKDRNHYMTGWTFHNEAFRFESCRGRAGLGRVTFRGGKVLWRGDDRVDSKPKRRLMRKSADFRSGVRLPSW